MHRYFAARPTLLPISLGLLLASACVGPNPRDSAAALDESQLELNGPADGDWRRWVEPTAEDQPQPKLVCEEPILRVGPVWEGSKQVFRWEVGNAGAAPLRLWLWP